MSLHQFSRIASAHFDEVMVVETTEELEHMLENFATHLKSIEGKRATQKEMRDKEDAALDDLRKRERSLASAQGGLVANRNVIA